MKRGYLSQYFTSVAAKRLSAVETDTATSNQHEFNGSKELKQVLGGETERETFPAKLFWFGDENKVVTDECAVTWYDARYNHPTRSEYRLYFPTTEVSSLAREDDMMFIALRPDRSVMIIITASGTTIENQLRWLFDIDENRNGLFDFTSIEKENIKVDFAARAILEELGIEADDTDAAELDHLLEKFNGVLPSTQEFSEFSRSTLGDISALDDPDLALVSWIEREEKLFRRIEHNIVAKRLSEGFVKDRLADVDGFISFSLGVHNRRKARAGFALENHLQKIFHAFELRFTRGGVTENRSKPDFMFPGITSYHDNSFQTDLLTMLAAKTTCKERWRQALAEANRIEKKHLLTLEPGISEHQTREMMASQLQLVLPAPLHITYSETQQRWLMNLRDFISMVKDRQESAR